jgi:hypothetical protein
MAGSRSRILGIVERDEMALAGKTALKMLANVLDGGRILRASAEDAGKNEDREGLHREMLENSAGFAREEPCDRHAAHRILTKNYGA